MQGALMTSSRAGAAIWRSSSSSSNHRPLAHRSLHKQPRRVECAVSVSLNDSSGDKGAGPDLSSLNKLNLSNAMLLANLLRPPGEQFRPGNTSDTDLNGPSRPNDPATAVDFVHALECIVRSSSNQPNPEQFDEVILEVLEQKLAETFTPQQLASTLKNLAVIGACLPEEFVQALVTQAGHHMTLFNIPQLSNVNWALMRLMPVADEAERQGLGMDQQWLQQYHAACEQQLQQVVQRQQPLPTGQQLANLLLLPAAVQQPFGQQCLQLYEEALLLSERRMCGMAVAQLFTCYVRLQQRPQQPLLDMMLQHLQEDLLLYDFDQLTQVAVGAYALQLSLPNTLLADMSERLQQRPQQPLLDMMLQHLQEDLLLYDFDQLTQVAVGAYALQLSLPNTLLADMSERCDMLEASGQAEQQDVRLMTAVMDRLARAAVAARS